MGGGGEEGPIWHGLAAGAIAGLCSRFVTYPTDTLKAQLQMHGVLDHLPAHTKGNVANPARGSASTLSAFMQVSHYKSILI